MQTNNDNFPPSSTASYQLNKITPPSLLYAKLGLRKSLFSCGESRAAIDYALNSDVERSDDKARSYAFVVNQVIDQICSELYVGVRSYTLNRPGENYHDLVAVMSGIRMRF